MRDGRKTVLFVAGWLSLIGFGVTGQEITGQLGDFRVPVYDEENVLQQVLRGEFARVLPEGQVDITNLTIEFYKGGTNVEMTVKAPQCTYDQRARVARSDSEVRVDSKQIKVTGADFTYDVANERFQVRKKARVEIKNARRRVDVEDGESKETGE